MSVYKKGEHQQNNRPKSVVDGSKTYCNPTDEQLVSAGWEILPDPVPTPPTLEQVKESQKQQIKWAFDQAGDTEGDVNRLGFVMQCGEKHILRMQSLYDYLIDQGLTDADDSPKQVRALDNTFHSVKVGDIPGIRLDMIAAGSARIEKKWLLEQQIEAAQTVEEVQAVTW